MGLFSKSSSSTTNQSTTNNYDQRSVNDASGGGIVGSRNVIDSGNTNDNSVSYLDQSLSLSDNSSRYSYADNSLELNTSDSREWYSLTSDSSQRNTTNITGTDGGAVQIAALNADLLSEFNSTQSDAVKTMAGFGTDALRTIGGSATDLFSTAASNSARSWATTVSESSRLIDRLLTTADKTTAAANQTASTIAATAINSFQPTDNKQADSSLKLGMIAAAAMALFVLMRKG